MKIGLSVKFLGGVADGDNLTGACTLVQIRRGKNLTRILIDAGLLQCEFKNQVEKNKAILLQLDSSKIDYVILTHSHIDHVGRLPLLVKEGFKGKVICTESTNKLINVMLQDTARIQTSEARYLSKKAGFTGKSGHNKKRGKNHRSLKADMGRPLYGLKDVENAFALVKNGGFDYYKPIKLATCVSVKFYPSGHVLGGAICILEIQRPKPAKPIYLGFSGDLGREDGIILPSPKIVEEPVNYWFIESTYGGNKHPGRDEEISKLLEIVTGAVERKQKIIIPSFALERTQEIVYLLSYFMHKKTISKIPIYLDSPMALKITLVYANNWKSKMFKDQGMLRFNPFDVMGKDRNPYLRIVSHQLESAQLSKSSGPHIIIAGSGMCDAGRVRNHLRAGLGSDNTIVCLVGYMAKDSLGWKLREGFPLIRMNCEEIMVKASIVSFNSFSAHADGPFLSSYTNKVVTKDPNADKKIFIVHGEKRSGSLLKCSLLNSLPGKNWRENIVIPELNESITIL